MTTEEALLIGNDLMQVGLSREVLSLCSELINQSNISCDGLVLIIREIIKEIE